MNASSDQKGKYIGIRVIGLTAGPTTLGAEAPDDTGISNTSNEPFLVGFQIGYQMKCHAVRPGRLR